MFDRLDRAEQQLLRLVQRDRVPSALARVGPTGDVALEIARQVRAFFDEAHAELARSLADDERALLWSLLDDAIADLLRADLDPESYYEQLALAFVRGRLDMPDASRSALLSAAREAEISLHKFKRKDGPPRVKQVLSLLRGLSPQHVLDIGSGRGAFLWPLLARYPQLCVTAIDRLDHRVHDIQAVRNGGIARLDGQLGDVTALPFDDNAFDVVTILEVLEHLRRPAAAAAEVMRVAARFVIASVPSRQDDNPEHIQLFSPDTLSNLFDGRAQLSHVRGHMIALVKL